AFGALGEARKAAFLAQRPDTVAPAGQDLVRIGLMADVPQEAVVWRIEDVVKCDGQLHHTQTCAEMSTRLRDGVNRLGAQFRGELRKLMLLQSPQICGNANGIQERCFGWGFHARHTCQVATGIDLTAVNVNVRMPTGSIGGQRNELLLVARYDVEAAGAPFLLGLLDALA